VNRFIPLVALAIGACHHAHASGDSLATVGRIVHGQMSVTGTSFEQQLVLQTAGGPLRLHATPADSADLVRVQGAELSVRGVDESGALSVSRFTVVRVGNDSVVDGTLRRDGDRLVLDTDAGPRTLGNPPSALRTMVGARVWVQGPLDRGPNAYGVIRPASG
jgi:hypothetical protein